MARSTCVWLVSRCLSSSVAASKTSTLPTAPTSTSPPATATECAGPPCTSSTATHRRDGTSHARTVPSSDAVYARPGRAGSAAASLTQLVWPDSAPAGAHDAGSHTGTSWSDPAHRSSLPTTCTGDGRGRSRLLQ
jgi:hypothetical protein